MVADVILRRFTRRLARQLVAAFVLRVAGVALDPFPFNGVSLNSLIQPLPQIDILDRFFVGGFPTAFLPVMDPAGNALAHVLAVGAERHGARHRQRFQRHDRRHHFHAVIGGQTKSFAEGFFRLLIAQYRAVATGARVAKAGAVGENFYLFEHLW